MMVTVADDFDVKNYCLVAILVNDDNGIHSMMPPKPKVGQIQNLYTLIFQNDFRFNELVHLPFGRILRLVQPHCEPMRQDRFHLIKHQP